MKPKILIITLLLLCCVQLSQGSIPPNNPRADLGLLHETTPKEMGCVADDESQGLIENEGVTNTRAGVCSTIVGADYGTAATGNTHKYTGHIQDGATGQYYAKQRYFTTGLGRWSQPEPLLKGVPSKKFLLNPQALNPYLYCLNNPTKYRDPQGLSWWSDQRDDATKFWAQKSVTATTPAAKAGATVMGCAATLFQPSTALVLAGGYGVATLAGATSLSPLLMKAAVAATTAAPAAQKAVETVKHYAPAENIEAIKNAGVINEGVGGGVYVERTAIQATQTTAEAVQKFGLEQQHPGASGFGFVEWQQGSATIMQDPSIGLPEAGVIPGNVALPDNAIYNIP